MRRSLALVAAALVLASMGPMMVRWAGGPEGGLLPSFQSYAQLQWYLDNRRPIPAMGVADARGAPAASAPGAVGFTTAGPSYSTTNVQVQGVDEGDSVKTDGENLYLATPSGVAIVGTSPSGMLRNLSYVDLHGIPGYGGAWGQTRVAGLFVIPGRLAVLATAYPAFPPPTVTTASLAPVQVWMGSPMAFILVYDVREVERPALVASYGVSGTILTSRMVGGDIHLLALAYAPESNGQFGVPRVCRDGQCQDVDVTKIHYDPGAQYQSTFLDILSVDASADSFDYTSIVMGYASVVYMSPTALYLSFPKGWQRVGSLAPSPAPGTVGVVPDSTTVYRLAVAGLEVKAMARGEVAGQPLDQFSLDEDRGYLRITTTTQAPTPVNNLYVLDGELRLVGSLEGLAPGERIYATRFLGDRAYVVTFRRVDPLFAIDLSDPRNPRVLGYLKAPGFSQYLHPLDSDHLLGVGRSTTDAPWGDFGLVQGLKVSIFDVTDAEHPREVSPLAIGGRGTSSAVLWDHRAFLYVPTTGQVVIPVDRVDTAQEPWGYAPWRGVYVLAVGPNWTLSVQGQITHQWAGPSSQAWNPSLDITRSLYIGDFLYTISPTMVQVNALHDLSQVSSLTYHPAEDYPEPVGLAAGLG